jgi:nucleotide-binding universal stress UspA family protein
MLPLKKILWPTDFSDPADEGLKFATELATQFSAEMLVVHVVAPLPTMHGGIAPPSIHMSSVLQEIEESAKISLEEIRRERIPADIQARTFLIHGNPAHEIVNLAAQEKADIIVIATHGESGWHRLVFGSVAEKVFRIADCPVLTIRPAA